MKLVRLAGAISLLAVSLTAAGCTNSTNAFDWMGVEKEKPKVAHVGVGDPDLYQRSVPGEAVPNPAIPGGVASSYAPADVPDAMVSADLPPEDPPVASASRHAAPPRTRQPERRVAVLKTRTARRVPPAPPQVRAPIPQPEVRQVRAPAVKTPRAGQPRDSAGTFAPDEEIPAEMLTAQSDAANTPPAAPEVRTPQSSKLPVRVASNDQVAGIAPSQSVPPAGAPAGPVQPPAAIPPTFAPPKAAKTKIPQKNAGRSRTLGLFTLSSARYEREVTPVERLRASRKIFASKMGGGSGAVSGFTPPGRDDGIGLRGPTTGDPAGGGAGTVASLQAGRGGTGVAQATKPGAQSTGVPAATATPVTYPDRERPMRIYFAPGKKKLSSQTIASIVAVADTQRALNRPVHVVGVAAAKGAEGDKLDANALNRLALDRANAVASQLAESGVKKKDIVIHAQQEHRTANAAGGAPSARSRRVDIYLE